MVYIVIVFNSGASHSWVIVKLDAYILYVNPTIQLVDQGNN